MLYKEYEGKYLKGMVLRLERSSVFDGDGFRTVVFLKGCPLCCQWCSTPESQSFQVETTETNVYGMEMTVEEVLKEVRKDSTFYFHSGGGMTLSGGEILAQPEFSRRILERARWEGIDSAIETSLYARWDKVEPILRAVDTAFIDLKLMDSQKHKKYCGVDNALILDNMRKANALDAEFRMIIRIPLIPGVNDSEEELRQMGAFCRELTRMEYLELLPYHKLGTSTYEKLGRPYLLKGTEVPTPEHMDWCRSILREYVENIK